MNTRVGHNGYYLVFGYHCNDKACKIKDEVVGYFKNSKRF